MHALRTQKARDYARLSSSVGIKCGRSLEHQEMF